VIKIVTVLGARPQFIKAAALSRVFAIEPFIHEVIVHTGQHFDANMSDIFFEEMEIPKPDYNLNINSLSHGAMTGRMLEEIETILLKERPDCVLVYGDTNSTLAGALAARKLHLKIAHVEAGLRSFNMLMPEEVNRILTDRISDLLYCPTSDAVENLTKEGFENFPSIIEQVGDVMQDAAMFYYPKSVQQSIVLKDLDLEHQPYLLVTIHRAENTDDPKRLNNIIDALNQLSEQYGIVFPIHPRTKQKLIQKGLSSAVKVIDPVGYLDMIQLINGSKLVITDSGGLQKEAYFFSKFCITVRDETEWVELVRGGFNKLVSTEPKELTDAVNHFVNKDFIPMAELFGGGQASERICKSLLEHFDQGS